MKFKNRFLSAAAAVAILSTGLMAQSILDIAPKGDLVAEDETVEALTIAKEILVNQVQAVNLDTQAKEILYVPEIGMTDGSTLKLVITNGLIEKADNNELFLVKGTDDGNGGVAYAQVGKMTDILESTTDGYSIIKFQLTTDIASGTAVMISKASDTLTSPTILVDKNLNVGAKVTAQFTEARDDNAQPLTTPTTDAETLIQVVPGLTFEITKAESIINVNEERKHFDEDAGVGTTDLVSTATAVSVILGTKDDDGNVVTPDIGLALTAADEYDLTLSKSSCAGLADSADSVALSGDAQLEDYNTTASCQWHWTGDFGSGFGANMAAENGTIAITVTGEDVIAPGDWTVNLKVSTDEVEGATFDVAKGTVSHEWRLNGSQFIVPYLHTNAATYGTYVVITNTSNDDAEVTLDVYADKKSQLGEAQDAKACENVVLPKIPANSTATYYPTDLNGAIDATPGCANFSTENDRYMGLFSVVAPSNDIHAVAFQKDGINGKRSIPVLTNEAHNWKE